MNGRIMDIKRMAVHDGPGLRTTLFLSGCPLRCLWCHNPEGLTAKSVIGFFPDKCIGCGACVSVCPHTPIAVPENRALCEGCGRCADVCATGARKQYGRLYSLEAAVAAALEDRIFYGTRGGVTLSGGEPLMQADFALALLSALKQNGVHTALDTCAFAPWPVFEQALNVCDLFLCDVKHMNAETHRRLTGQSNEQILENLRKLSQSGAQIQIRVPLIPGLNDDVDNLRRTADFIAELNVQKVKLLPYHDMARVKYEALGLKMAEIPVVQSAQERVQVAWKLFAARGVVAYSDAV